MDFIYKWRKVILIFVIALLIIYLAPKFYGITPEQLLDHSPESPIMAAVIIVILYSIKPLIFIIPSVVLYLTAGIVFSPGLALIVTLIGLSAELTFGWMLGRWMGKEKIEALMRKNVKAEKILTRLDGKIESVIFMLRILPIPCPVGLGSMFFGASDVPYFKHLVFSIAGMSATMIPLTIAGSSLEYPITIDFFIPLAVSFFVVLIIFAVYKKVFEPKFKS